MDDGAQWATVLGVTKRQTRLSTRTSGVLTPETEQGAALETDRRSPRPNQPFPRVTARASTWKQSERSLSYISL